jgi:hypothetical protein
MNNEQHQIIDEVYDKWIKYSWNSRIYPNQNDKDIFIDRIKTEPDFSIHWGLKIEERELSDEESIFHYEKELYSPLRIIDQKIPVIPTKLITITRELSLDERVEYYCSQNWVLEHLKDSLRNQTPEQKTSVLSVANIPTNKKIESYE